LKIIKQNGASKDVMLMKPIGPSTLINFISSTLTALVSINFCHLDDYHASFSADGEMWIVFTSERNGFGQAYWVKRT
jgi:hypothetical protein